MKANRTFFNDTEQPTRQIPATAAFYSPDAMINHAASQNRYDLEPLEILSSDHRPILFTIHLPTEKLMMDKRLVWDLNKGDLAGFTTTVDEQLRGRGLTDGECFTHIYRSF